MRSYDSFNDYNSYTSFFKSPFNFKQGGVNKDVSKLWLKRLEENRRAEELRMQANNRSNWDRTFDALSSVNYGVAGLASGLVDWAQGDEGAGLGQAFKQAGQGFMHGINIFSNDTSDEDEYTFSRVMDNMGWRPTTLGGKIARGVLGFGLDVALDPTTYMTFGASALLKGTGKAGKGVQKLAEMADDIPRIRFENKVDELVKQGVRPELAERVAFKRYDADIAKGTGKVTHMTDDIASEIVKKHYRGINKVATKEEIAGQAQKFASEFNRLVGARTGNKGPGISFGIANAPFGDKLAQKMGKLGKTRTILDNDDFMRALGDKIGTARGYAKMRDAVYGSQIGKMFSTNHPIYKLAVKNPVELFKFVEAMDYAKGLKGNKIQKEKQLRDMAKAMNADLTPAEMKEVINIMENKTVQGKIKKIITLSQTAKGKEMRNVISGASTKLKSEIDMLNEHYDTLEQMRQASEVDVQGAKQAYDDLEKEYHDKLASIDIDKVKDENQVKQLKHQYQTEIRKLEKRIKDVEAGVVVDANHFEGLYTKAIQEIEDFKQAFKDRKAKAEENAKPKTEGEDGKKKPKKKTTRAPKEEGKSDRTIADKIAEKYEAEVKEVQNDPTLGRQEKKVKMKEIEARRSVETRIAHEAYKNSKVDGTKATAEDFINSSEEDLSKFEQDIRPVAREELLNELSKYIYGKPDRLAKGIHMKTLEELIGKIAKGASPQDLERYIDNRPQAFSEHHLEVNNYLAKKFRYDTWENAYHKKMEPIAEKLKSGKALTNAEEREYLKLLSLNEARTQERIKVLHKMDYDQFKDYKARFQNNHEVGDMFDEIDLEKKRNSALNSQSAQHDDINAEIYDSKGNSIAQRGTDMRDIEEKMRDDLEPRQQYLNNISGVDKEAIFKDATAIYGSKIYQKEGKFHDVHYNQLTRITEAMAQVLANMPSHIKYNELSPSQRHSVFAQAVRNMAGKNDYMKPEVAEALIGEATRRNKQTKLDAILNNTKIGSDVTFIGGFPLGTGRAHVGMVVKTEPTTQGTKYTVKLKDGSLQEVFARDIQANHGMNKKFLTAEETTYLSKVSNETLTRKAELEDNINKLSDRFKEIDDLAEYKRKSANNFYKSELSKAEKNIQDLEHNHKLYVDGIEALDFDRMDGMVDKLKELERALSNNDALEIWARMHNEHDLQNLKDPERWAHVKENSPMAGHPDAVAWADDTNIHLTGKPITSDPLKNRIRYFEKNWKKLGVSNEDFTKTFKGHPERIKQFILEHEQSHIKNKDFSKTHPRQWGNKAYEDIEFRADVDAFNMTKAFDPQAIIDAETFLTRSAKNHLSQVASSPKIENYVNMLTKEFADMGMEEVSIGKLGKDQFREMVEHYVPHIPTEDGARFIENSQEMKDFNARVTQKLGFGQKWNPNAKSRTIKGKSIDEINKFFDAKMKGKNLFSENIADIFLTRALKHEELMYDDSYMKHMMDVFGTEMKAGDEIEKGFHAVANYGHLRNLIKSRVAMLAGQAKKKGVQIDDTFFENATKKVLNHFGLPKGILDEFATPMIELTQEQVNKLAPFGFVKSVNEAIVGKTNQARKLQIAKDQSNFLKIYDKFLHIIKLNQTTVLPAFHIRNKLSNLYLGWLGVGRDAVNPRMQSDALKTVHFKGDMDKIKDLRPITIRDADGNVTGVKHWNEIYEEALAHGVVDEGFFAKEFGSHAKTKGVFKKLHNVNIKGHKFNLDPTDTDNFFGYKYGAEVGGRIENGDRLLQFASHLRKGKTAEQAADEVKKFLFDYSDLTAFEQHVMKRIFPYYTWLRKNGRLQASQLIEQPGKYRDTAKAMHAVSDMNNEDERVDRRMMAPFAQDWVQTPFGKDGEPIMLNPNLPFQDLNNMPNLDDIGGTIRNLAGKTSPLIKAPLEVATNHNVFYDAPISEEGSDNPIGDKLQHVVNQTGWGAAIDGYNDKASGTGKALQALSTLGGIKATNYNEEVMEGHLRDDGKVRYGDENNDKLINLLDKGILSAGAHLKVLAHKGLEKVSPAQPTKASDYTGAMRPISETTYNELSKEEKKKYTPPTKKDATAYSKRAQELEKEQYEKSGKFKKFLWTLLDATDIKSDKPEVGRVMEVIDGDTFIVKIGKEEKKVRMLLMDTPESAGQYADNPMPEGVTASYYSKGRLKDKDIKLTYEGSKHDYYGRNVAYISVDDEDYNKELIEKGLAKVRFTHPDLDEFNPKYSRTKEYFKAEKKADKKKRGIHKDKYGDYANPGKDSDYFFGSIERYLNKGE